MLTSYHNPLHRPGYSLEDKKVSASVEVLYVKEAEGNSHAVILMKNGNQVHAFIVHGQRQEK